MVNAVHRLIEHHASTRGDAVAVADADARVNYYDLNVRANALARQLMAAGFRRGSHAVVEMDRSAHLAVLLLGVLKAGGAYSWCEAEGPRRQARTRFAHAPGFDDNGDRYQVLDIDALVATAPAYSPNLPILTRGGEVACVLPDRDERLTMLVPHESLVALHRPVTGAIEWGPRAGAFDPWIALMAGATLSVTRDALESAA